MSTLPYFTDRRYDYGQEKQYQLKRQDGSVETVELEKVGIAEEGSRINAAALNPLVDHANSASAQIAQLSADVSNLKTRVNVMESTLPDNFLYNHFKDDLSTIDGIKVIRGYYNEAQTRLEV
ncbi:hypothetical protein [Brevibacillus centrosporus]|uniref:hypothetical protein n=1 Tax=Brevibacillus centrosporus TaxID=54910 RepID=UPI002E1BAADD|nr:hypothetical protein [Brevibacillus centrosporus]